MNYYFTLKMRFFISLFISLFDLKYYLESVSIYAMLLSYRPHQHCGRSLGHKRQCDTLKEHKEKILK